MSDTVWSLPGERGSRLDGAQGTSLCSLPPHTQTQVGQKQTGLLHTDVPWCVQVTSLPRRQEGATQVWEATHQPCPFPWDDSERQSHAYHSTTQNDKQLITLGAFHEPTETGNPERHPREGGLSDQFG